ncbi:MAG TPA: patatin-like phospholipase family protein [Candidatus Limnocylindria bacterium]|nr:patatin-like phospholipase family protein [Candidatus Limnocylindria bacterium]
MRRILSIDGGGIRGIIPAILLADLERRTGRLTRETFHFVAGTSTGAVLAAGIAAGIPAAELARLYERRSAEVFRHVPVISTLRRIATGAMYDTTTLHRVIREELGEAARDWRLNDAPIDLLITAKRLSDGMPWYFVRDNPANSCRAGDYPLADAATASAAAPTYLKPWPIGGIGELIDGGTGVAGNPVYQACVEAFEYTNVYHPSETVVVSLGTGRLLRRDRPTWIWPWLGWLLSELLRSPAEQQTELVHRHYRAAAFYRLDLELEREIGLDAVGRIGELRALGERRAADVDWIRILDGTDDRYLVTDASTLPREYCRIGPA